MVALVKSAMRIRRREIEEERCQQRQRELAQKKWELDRLKREETARVQQLNREVDDWVRSRQIREYAEAVRAYLVERDGQIAEEGQAEAWLAWALEQADRFDPLSPSPHSVLDAPEPGF